MSDTIRGLSKEQVEEVIQLFNPYMDDYLYIMDLKQDYYRISKHAVERFMLPGDSFFDATNQHRTFVYAEDLPMLMEDIGQMLRGEKKSHNLHYRWLDKKGMPIWINCRGAIVDDKEGKPRYLIGCINETGKKQRADNTSGLLGELELSAYVKAHLAELPKGFLMRVGIDDFSVINGAFGVAYGNYILKSVAGCINECLRGNQHLFHLVADEYMIVDFVGHTAEDAVAIYRNIRKKIAEFIDAENYKTVFTISAGIMETTDCVGEYEDFIKLSDFTLKKVKDNGKNGYYIFQEKEYEDFLRKSHITMKLYHAVDNRFEGFAVHYQPIVDGKTSRILGAEALMRFSMPTEQGMEGVSPFEFVPLLEKTGLIIPAGRWILEEAAAMCSEMQKYIPGFKININISHVQVMKSAILSDILSVMKRYKLSPECLGIELTESGYLDKNPHFLKLRSGLRENGIPFIIDDFGTGYSNLHCLSDLSPTYIKIDKDFTNKAMENAYDHELMVKIIEMAHTLKLQICVEGVETEDVLANVRAIYADYIQGYLFGRPCSKEDFLHTYCQ